MLQKIKKKIENITIKIIYFNILYIDYLLCISFLNLIIFKLNKIVFQIPLIYLYPMVILISILFINQWSLLTNQIKNTYIFNWFLYYFLIFKNSIYRIIFEFFEYLNKVKYQNLMVTGFVLSSWSLNIVLYAFTFIIFQFYFY